MATRKDEGFLLDTYGNRVKSGSGDYVRTGSYDDAEVTENRMEAARKRLSEDVQEKLKADAAAEKKTAEKKASTEPASTKPASTGPASTGPAAGSSNLRDPQQMAKPKEVVSATGQRAPKQTFGQAFAAARKAGDKKFNFNGKSFTTETKEDVAKRGKKPTTTTTSKPATTTSKPATTTSKPATTTSKPAGASGILDPQQKAQQKAQPSEPAAKPSAPATSNKKPPPFKPPAFKFFKSVRERGEADLKSRGMKKGGSVSSASKRADGIAQRGKTRGKVY